ncbi:MAG: hypothetical protein CMJ58_02780 [Planctomycetaceae bacterium]|nr:hypothetical protein [Planctomycetaceae bacterium]
MSLWILGLGASIGYFMLKRDRAYDQIAALKDTQNDYKEAPSENLTSSQVELSGQGTAEARWDVWARPEDREAARSAAKEQEAEVRAYEGEAVHVEGHYATVFPF